MEVELLNKKKWNNTYQIKEYYSDFEDCNNN